jgi:glycosyltransferase involved in cell wall biosynthesis
MMRRSSPKRILYVQYTNPAGYPPLEHSSGILRDAGWQVLFLGTGSFGSDDLRLAPDCQIKVRQLPFREAGWRQKVQYLWFAAWVLAWTLRWRPDWVYASDLLACPVALVVSCLPRIRVLYHEHDTPVELGPGPIARLCAWSRRRLARRARLRVLPSQPRTTSFRESTGALGPTLTVWNCPRREEVSGPRLPAAHGALEVVYHGSIAPARLPLSVVEALVMLPSTVRIHVLGYATVGYPEYVQTIRETAVRLGVENRLQLYGTVALRRDLLRTTERFDVGLALMPTTAGDLNMRSMAGASNKPFDYLARGLALLVSDLPDWRAMYVEPGYGVACRPEDPASIAAVLRWFLDHPAEMRSMGERGRQRVEREWNYETQFAPVLEQIT